MSFRFFRRIRIAPGVTLNLSKRGASASFGPRGAKVTVGRTGIRRTVGIPGTGLYHTSTTGRKTSRKRSSTKTSRRRSTPKASRFNLSLFQKLFTPADEQNFVKGLREYSKNSEGSAYHFFSQADGLADAAFMAGIIALKEERLPTAENHFLKALRNRKQLNSLFTKYGASLEVELPITEHIRAPIAPNAAGVHLALVEIYQNLKRPAEALASLRELHATFPDDHAIILSLAEILVLDLKDSGSLQKAVALTAKIENRSEIEAAILHLKGRALRKLGLFTAARTCLTSAFRRKKDRSPELLRAIQYERALTYEALGQNRRARQELEQIFSDAPNYEDVAARLGL